MKHFILVFAALFLWVATPCIAKGHGGGHGGHGGHGHGGGYSGGRSSYGATSRTTSGSTSRIVPPRAYPVYKAPARAFNYPVATGTGYAPGVRGEYGYFIPYPIYPYSPFYDPFMMGFGASFMYSPSYNYLSSPYNFDGNDPNYNEDETIQGMKGYVVFENDTLKGKVSVTNRTVSLENSDSVRNYDYVFTMKKEGLKYVTVYNTDSSQLNLVRLSDAPKRLLRVVHEGKLDIYDGRHKFIYRPEDIDIRSMVIVYNGEVSYLRANSMQDAKIRLTQFVNKAYGTDLDPKNFTWKQLLIYVDKLD